MTPDKPMDPKVPECVGFYLYGAGYYSRDENTLGLVTGQQSPPHFCLTCVARERCENEHERRVRDKLPEMAEQFDRLMAEALRRDIPVTLAAVMIGKEGKDPYALVAVENFNLGHAHRGSIAGPLVQ
jgi:hypothetical protein